MKTALFEALMMVAFVGIGTGQTPATNQAGYALLDRLVGFFHQTASSTTVSYHTINQAITEMMGRAKAAKAEQRIDEKFFSRYTRVLRIFKLRITEDKEGVLGRIIDQEYTAFVRDVTGKQPQGVPSIAMLSQAVTQELANLKKFLEQRL
jgi:hypothetical protein